MAGFSACGASDKLYSLDFEMDPVIARSITKAKLLKMLPRDLATLCSGLTLLEPYAVAIFKKMPVRLGMVEKALRRLDENTKVPLLLVGSDFTSEALACAEAHGAHVVESRHFGWTEERFDDIRTSIATGKKRPLK